MRYYENYLYGAYGSNLNMSQMSVRCPKAKPVGSLILKDWKLVFRGVADIEEAKGHEVALGLWYITKDCLKALDRYEGFPYLYGKKHLKVKGVQKSFAVPSVMIYVMNDQERVAPPPQTYLNAIANGYNDFGLDKKLLQEPVMQSYVKEKHISPRRKPYLKQFSFTPNKTK